MTLACSMGRHGKGSEDEYDTMFDRVSYNCSLNYPQAQETVLECYVNKFIQV